MDAVNIIPSKLAEATNTIQYTVSSGRTIIDKFTVTNISSVVVSFSCHLPVPGDSVGTSNRVIGNQLINVNETYTCPGLIGHILEKSGTINTIAGAADVLMIRASGREDI